jgi:tartrate dehydrogenase/decarboxylase/D-malate dehydrogenase
MAAHRIAVIAGDGIGQEVMPQGMRVLDAAARGYGIDLRWDVHDWGCHQYERLGGWMPSDWKARLGGCDAIYFGACGWPAVVPDHVSLWDSLLKFRREFDQYVNLRPVRLMPGVACPQSTFTRIGVDRVLRFAFEFARQRPRRRVASATKSNGIAITMPFRDERYAIMAAQYPQVTAEQYHVDALTIKMVLDPGRFDVLVASNLFGDILSDLGPATTGTIGIAPSANLNPERRFPSLFEPVHGSAPDICGKGVANPLAQIWAGAMLLEHLGHAQPGAAVVRAIEDVLRHGPRTPDLGGEATTEQVGDAVCQALAAGPR